MAWTNPRTWVSGETVTAALMNTHVRDNLKALSDPWTAYTPTWTAATTNPTIGNGTLSGAYIQAGKLVMFRIRVLFGSTTNAGSGFYSWALPAVAVADLLPVGHAIAFDTSANAYSGRPAFTGDGVTNAVRAGAADAGGGVISNNAPYTWATGDEINISGAYEAA